MPTFRFAHPPKNARVEEQRQIMSDPFVKRQLAEKVVHALNLKVKTHNLASNDEWQVSCPFHLDKTPSMFIAPEKFVYHCFSCQSQGSLSSLYYRITSRSFYKDFDIVNDEFSTFSFDPSNYVTPDYSVIDRDVNIHIRGDIFPVDKHPEAIVYLRSHGIPFDIAKSMQMGFMDHGSINGTTFNKRLTIPVYEGSKLLSVEGRDTTGQQACKVLYPKDSYVQTLYDVDILNRSEPLYVVEGLTKLAVLRTDPFFKNSTATFGAGIGERQQWLLRQFDRIVMIPDNDEAGKTSMGRLKEGLGKPFEILELPNLGIKDVGDIPQKLHTTVAALRKRGWGRTMKSSLALVFY
jgi:DNA primase